MICHGCFAVATGVICHSCRDDLRRPPERILPGGVRAIAAFDHTGTAARMVHALKYRGLETILDLAVDELIPVVPRGLTFVPVPRVWTRYLRYGIDPAQRLALRLADRFGGIVVDLIVRPLHGPRRAGSSHRGSPPRFRAKPSQGKPVALVDDVLTTGSTLSAAVRAIQPRHVAMVVTATVAKQVSSPHGSLPMKTVNTDVAGSRKIDVNRTDCR